MMENQAGESYPKTANVKSNANSIGLIEAVKLLFDGNYEPGKSKCNFWKNLKLLLRLLVPLLIISYLSALPDWFVRIFNIYPNCTVFRTSTLGMDLIGVLLAASFFVMTLLYTLPLLQGENVKKARREVLSQATLLTIFQVLFVLICYMIVSYSLSIYWLWFSQTFTLLFILISDIHIFLHIFALKISQNS